MAVSLYEDHGVTTTPPFPDCEHCAERPATVDGRWCSARCRFLGLRELRTAPTPDEIARRAAAVRATWTTADHRARSGIGRNSDDWTPPVVSVPEFSG